MELAGESADKLFTHGDTVALAIPKAIAERYHLAPGVEMTIEPGDDGIRLVPVGVPHWFSFEWEAALDAVLERYGSVFQMLKDSAEAPAEPAEAEAPGAPTEAEAPGEAR